MIRQEIYVPRYDWEVVVFYDTDRRDAPIVLDLLDKIGVDDATYWDAEGNLRSGYEDTGLTFSNFVRRMSVIVLSHTSSEAEFANTWVHEVGHCAKHIAIAYDMDCNGEPVQYISGELAREMQPVAARLMCPTCHCEQ